MSQQATCVDVQWMAIDIQPLCHPNDAINVYTKSLKKNATFLDSGNVTVFGLVMSLYS